MVRTHLPMQSLSIYSKGPRLIIYTRLRKQDTLTWITADSRHRAWAWLTGVDNAVPSARLQQTGQSDRKEERRD